MTVPFLLFVVCHIPPQWKESSSDVGEKQRHTQAATNPLQLLGASLQIYTYQGCWGLAGLSEKSVLSFSPWHGAN